MVMMKVEVISNETIKPSSPTPHHQKMVMMKVEVISNETIKPSSPTPHHLRTFNLSLLDQLTPSVYVRTILFYAAADGVDQVNGNNISDLLKTSLSETLTHFYPVAGRIKDNILVDCNDEGVDYFEAKVNAKIYDVMSRPDVLHHLLPSHIVSNNTVKEAQLIVQVNMFDCGGIAISVCLSHKIADASTITTFINGWAATARGETREVVGPSFDAASLFPSTELNLRPSFVPDTDSSISGSDSGKKVISKRFLFDASKIAALRAKIVDTSSSSTPKYPTRVEAVSALIWKSAMDVRRVKSAAAEYSLSSIPGRLPIISVVKHGVNMRGRMDPPLPNVSFGNIVTVATATSSGAEEDEWLDGLVGQLRGAISKINGDYIGKLQSGEFLRSIEEYSGLNGDQEEEMKVEVYWMTSWCKFPVYECDFGWEKPIWVNCANQPYKNVIVLMDTKCGEGIEAWVNMGEEDMAIFEHNLEQLLQFV